MYELTDLLKDHQLYHSKFQQDFFITSRAGGTVYGKYKQSLRELYKRTRSLRDGHCDFEKLLIEIEQLEHQITEEKDTFEKRLKGVELKKMKMRTEESRRTLKDTTDEFKRFYQQASWLRSVLGEITEARRDVLDGEMWEYRLKEMAVVDYVTQGRLRNSTFEFLHSLPKQLKFKLSSQLKDSQQLIQWYETKESIDFPEEFPALDKPVQELLDIDTNLLLEGS